jgi:hypothetical protein
MMAGVAVRLMYVDVEVKFLSLTFECRKKKNTRFVEPAMEFCREST